MAAGSSASGSCSSSKAPGRWRSRPGSDDDDHRERQDDGAPGRVATNDDHRGDALTCGEKYIPAMYFSPHVAGRHGASVFLGDRLSTLHLVQLPAANLSVRRLATAVAGRYRCTERQTTTARRRIAHMATTEHSATAQGSLQELAKRHLWMHFTRLGAYAEHDVPIIVRGEGCHVFDEHGNRYFDGLSALFCVNIGHGRADVAQAGADQARELGFYTNWSYAHPRPI